MPARQGVELSRQTMCDWMRQCAETVGPLYELMKQQTLRSKVFLKEYRGYLQADAHSGYDEIYKDAGRGVLEVACWAHARRKFIEAQTSGIMRSMVVLAYLHLLYDVEREARDGGLDATRRRELRQARSRPLLEDLKAYLERERPQVLPRSPIAQAISYTLSNWDALVRYMGDGDLEIDNNGAERSLRGVAVGRRNWTFFGSGHAGHTAAVLGSLIASAKRHHVDPFVYLRDVFQPISAHPRRQLEELLPDRWLARQATAR